MNRKEDLDSFTEAYIECALWSTNDEDGTPLNACDYAISDETRARMSEDCAKFVQQVRVVLDAVEKTGVHGDTYAMAGHDFWLTRNHHGAGFWDGDWDMNVSEASGETAKVLTNAAHAFGEYDLYVGDDGVIYGA